MKLEKREYQAYKLAKANKALFLDSRSKFSRSHSLNSSQTATKSDNFEASLNAEQEDSAIRKNKLDPSEKQQLKDLENLYWKAFNTLEGLFKNDFKQSKSFKDMVLLLNQNSIEYKFMRQAGVLNR